MSENLIAIIYEGERFEKKIFDNVNKVFFERDKKALIPVFAPAEQNIYMLFEKMKEDDFETDIIEVIKENSKSGCNELKAYERRNFAEIYLFLDHDVHHNLKDSSLEEHDIILNKMIEVFDNETESGKLYINYPMCESLRDLNKRDTCDRRCKTEVSQNRRYKDESSNKSEFLDSRKYKKEDWLLFCNWAMCKANCIVNSRFEIPTYNDMKNDLSQEAILKNQMLMCIETSEISILNSIPLFLLEYYEEYFYKEATSSTIFDIPEIKCKLK